MFSLKLFLIKILMNMIEELLESYDNDGYIYCLMTGLSVLSNGSSQQEHSLVKIGKIGMKKNENEQQVIDKLLRRYNTYYPDYDVIHFMRVGNCHKAELSIFESLKHLHYKREIYTYNINDITSAFEKARREYPSIQERLENTDISIISELNKILREREFIN
jgi:hypothetical protein